MTDSYQQTLESARAAVHAGQKQQAIDLLKQAAGQNPADPQPWLQMVYAAPSKKLALEYLAQAKQRKANILNYTQAKRWLENFFDQPILEETPPTPGIADTIRYRLQKYPHLVALVYLALLAQAEATTVARDPRLGMAFHGLCFAILILHASYFSDRKSQPFLLSLALTPLIRLLSLTLPISSFPVIYWYAIVGIPLFLATYLMIRTTNLTNKRIGLTVPSFPVQIAVGFTGILLGYIEFLILRPEPLVNEFSFEAIILPALILMIFTGFLEELIFRGVFQYFAIRYIGRWGLLYCSFVFAVFHLGYRSAQDFIFVFAVALLFSYLVHKTGSILGVSIAHGITNICLYLVFPLLLL